MIDGRDVDWTEAMASAQPADCVPVAATDPLYILYTSGTTGQPKGVVRDNGGHGGPEMDHESHLRHRCRRRVVGGFRCGLGRRSFLHCLRPAVQGRHHHPVRRQTGGNPGCRCVLAGHLPAQGQMSVYGAHGVPGHQARGSQGRTDEKLRSFQLQDSLSGRRTVRSGHDPVVGKQPQGSGHRSLVADGNRLGHCGQLHGPESLSRQVRIADQGCSRMGPSSGGRQQPAGGTG
jgi:hypothetical protein